MCGLFCFIICLVACLGGNLVERKMLHMEVGILTWYQSNNHGAVLQAYALSKAIQSTNRTCKMVPYERNVKPPTYITRIQNLIKRICNGSIRFRTRWSKFDSEKAIIFKRFIDAQFSIGNDYSDDSYDAIVIGSDMVFDLVQGFNPYMFGIGIKSPVIISYAASSGGEKSLQLARKWNVDQSIKEGLLRFKGIGCRDNATIDFVQKISGIKNVVPTIDPVLLYGFSDELKNWGKPIINEPYLLIYAYHGYMDSRIEVASITRFAKSKNLKVVSCGYYHNWCDINFNASPEEFISLFKNAVYVVTDTFHGTVFSLICHKQFGTIIRNNSFKITDLLNKCGEQERIIHDISQLQDCLNNKIDYLHFNSWLHTERERSYNYLLERLKTD